MPHGNKKARVNAKKRVKASRPTQPPPATANGGAANGTNTSNNTEPRPPVLNEADLNRLLSWQQSQQKNSSRKASSIVDNISDTLYVRYKKCTQRFKETLQSMVPREIFLCNNVNAIMSAAEYIAENDLKIEPQLLDDLKVAIRVRKRVAFDKFSGGDEGHSYFILALAYCWSLLAPKLPRKARVSKDQAGKGKSSFSNQFESLSLRDDEEEDLEEDLPSSSLPRPVESVPTRLTLEELISGSDRMNVSIFLMTLDELMGFISLQYSKLKEASAWIQRDHLPVDIVIEQMMEASVATNFAIQQVASLEEVFVHDHPHLNTVYRMLACFVLVEVVQNLTTLVSQKSPIASHFSEKNAIEFLGDVFESSFRNPSDPHNKQDLLGREFLKRWQLSDDLSIPSYPLSDVLSVSQIVEGVNGVAKMEATLHAEAGCELRQAARKAGSFSHTWLSMFSSIGKNRSITHTIRLLQGLSNLIKVQNGRLIPRRGAMFGPSWSDRRTPATRIQVDMDSLFMEDIMPTLINMCHEGFLSRNPPFQEELLTAFSHVKMFVLHPEQPVSWSLAFTAHAILTAIFEVQGSNHFSFLAKTSKLAFEKYLQQLGRAKEVQSATIPQLPPIWDFNIKSLLTLQLLPVSHFRKTESEVLLSSWNPFCAGAFLTYLAYFGNLEGGASLVDSVAQLRMTLHLFNALKQAEAIKPGQIEVLDWLFEAFKNCKAIWEGVPPTRGQYQTRWWISFGMTAGVASQMQNEQVRSNRRSNDPTRKMTPIEPEHLSISFRRICRRDFKDVVDVYHSASALANQNGKGSTVYNFAVRVNDTLDAMERDERLLGTNLISLGYYLTQFCISLFDEMGFTPMIDQFILETTPEVKQGRRTDFRSVRPHSWEASDANMKYQALHHTFAKFILEPMDRGDSPVASKCATFMEMYFHQIPPENVMWFTPTSIEED